MWDPYAEFQSATLPNGLTVHAAHWPGRPWEAMGFLVHSGASQDPVGLEGVAHFVEHLVSENSGMRKKDLKALFENCGGEVNFGSTGYFFTRYTFFAPMDRIILAQAFSVFGQMLLLSKLEKKIERERQVIIGEFHRRYPVKLGFDLTMQARRALYSGCWLERFPSTFGTSESIRRISGSDLQSYYDAHYTPANISVVGVGGVTLPDLVGMLSESPFAANKPGPRTFFLEPDVDAELPLETRYVFETSKHIKMVVPTAVGAYESLVRIPGNVNEYALRLFGMMLREALFEEVRERRAWTYAIDNSHSYFQRFYEFAITCNALAVEALGEIEEIVETCLASMNEREDLFEKTKRHILAKHSMMDPNGRGVRDGALDDLVDNQRIVPIAKSDKGIARVTMDDIRGLLQWLKPERRWTLIVKP